MLNKAVFVEF